MTTDKLTQIIADKNEHLEREAIRRASQIIDEIARSQEIVADQTRRIETLRKELTELQVQQISTSSILG